MNENYKILLVDDEEDILDLLEYNLSKEGYKISTADNGKKALKIAKKEIPDLIIMDVMMPEMDGMEACKKIREVDCLQNTIITFLTARNEDYSQIAGFEAGADDYITKPIKPKVLLSKIKGLLRRKDFSFIKEQEISVLEIDREKYLIRKNGVKIILPRKEFELIELLHSKPDHVFTREVIYNSVWGENVIVGDRTIDVHIRKLRKKIGSNLIITVKGVGYKYIKV